MIKPRSKSEGVFKGKTALIVATELNPLSDGQSHLWLASGNGGIAETFSRMSWLGPAKALTSRAANHAPPHTAQWLPLPGPGPPTSVTAANPSCRSDHWHQQPKAGSDATIRGSACLPARLPTLSPCPPPCAGRWPSATVCGAGNAPWPAGALQRTVDAAAGHSDVPPPPALDSCLRFPFPFNLRSTASGNLSVTSSRAVKDSPWAELTYVTV